MGNAGVRKPAHHGWQKTEPGSGAQAVSIGATLGASIATGWLPNGYGNRIFEEVDEAPQDAAEKMGSVSGDLR